MQAQGEGRNNNPGSSAEEKIIGKVEKVTMKVEKGRYYSEVLMAKNKVNS